MAVRWGSLIGLVTLTATTSCASKPSPVSAPAHVASGKPSAPEIQLQRASIRMLSELHAPLELELYASRDFEDIARAAKAVERLLQAYARVGGKNVRVHVENPTGSAAGDAWLGPVQREGGRTGGFFGMLFAYRGERSVIPVLPVDSDRGLEYWTTTKIRELRDKAEHRTHRIGIITGKDELKLSDPDLVLRVEGATAGPNLLGIMKQAFPFYSYVPVDLQGGSTKIDGNLEGLIITQPGQDYVRPELQRIDDFVMLGGKSLVVLASAVNLGRGQDLLATLSTHGLESLLSGYGIRMQPDVVWDQALALRLDIKTSDEDTATLRYPPVPVLLGNAESPAVGPLDVRTGPFFRMEALAFPDASSLTLLPDVQPADVQIKVIARSSSAAITTRQSPVNLYPKHAYPEGEMQSVALAVEAQGRLLSAFPMRTRDGSLHPVAARSSRLLVISSSTFLANPFVIASRSGQNQDHALAALAQPYTKNLTPAIVCFKNISDWIINDDDFAALGALAAEH